MMWHLWKPPVCLREKKNKQAEFILNLKRTGKKYGVHHSAFDVSPLSAGTRTLDAVGMVAQPSTNTVRGRNDFEGESVFMDWKLMVM